MSRPLRIEYPGAIYQITVRGNADNAIFLDDDDRNAFLKNLGEVCLRFNWSCHAYCLLDSEYQLLIETEEANLSRGMREVNGVYTQAINRKYKKRGHVLEGRYQAIVVEREYFLAALHRKIVLLPVHRQLVESPLEWPWSNYRALMGKTWAPVWLNWKDFLSSFAKSTGEARRKYEKFIAEERYLVRKFIPRAQIILGSQQFIETIQSQFMHQNKQQGLIRQQRSLTTLREFEEQQGNRNQAIKAAFASGAFTLKQIGEYFKLHYTTVSRIARR